MPIPVESFYLDPQGHGTLQARIQQMVADGILSGRFRRGEKLPSTRRLARHLNVSRITVTLAYTELLASDYLMSRDRSGFYVSDGAPEPPEFQPAPKGGDAVDWAARLPTLASVPKVDRPEDWQSYPYPFIYGQPDPALFDHANWRLSALKALGARDFPALMRDQFDRDDPELVGFIARHTLPRRGIFASPDEILVTMGAQNALWLAATLLTPGRVAVVEDPCYPDLRGLLAQTGARMHPVPVDEDGLPPDAVPQNAEVIFTTPSHQCPTSATLPRARRDALLTRAAELDALVVEDDYEFEMSFLKPPSPALKSLDREGRVIYVGSFSKSLFPGLRLGYLVGPPAFVRAARALRATTLRHPPGVVMRTAAHFLQLGHYDALIRRMSRALHARRAKLEAAIAAHGLRVAGRGAFGGSGLWMQAPGVDMGAVAKGLRDTGVLIEPGEAFFAGPDRPRGYYRLGYSSIPEDRIADGVARIAQALAEPGAGR